MTEKIKVMTIFGTRPEAIKMAPLVHALEQSPDTESIVCVTAQHRQMLDQVLEIFHIRPDYDLNIMESRQTLATITEKSLHGLDEVLEQAKPDLVLVHGDTSTTFAGALAAFYHKIPVGHVEAGLRTYDKYSPFPEEMNRKLVGQIADLHFAPTVRNRDNLFREQITDGVLVCGNTVVDAIHMTVKRDFVFRDPVLQTLDFEKNRVVLVTAHRRENYGEPMENICRAIARLSARYPDVHFVYPVHL
ncbi:MAG: UDP-N-acetylglucosamine 2-epimerase (non-hydrolyzing), partial [Butyricicoccus pullicaecorum]|nr:UDP-N-acetylglucosamine 2-epimerase (non-hydrolyzing) [Butyricicoccus pullicaecorum]